MNAGRDYAKAKRQAQANADLRHEPYVLHQYGGVWWVTRLSSYDSGTPAGAEVVKPAEERSKP